MFTVVPKNHLPAGIKLVSSGAILGRWGVPISFSLTSEIVTNPFDLVFDVIAGKDRPEIIAGNIENRKLITTVYIQSKSLPTYSIGRFNLLHLAGVKKRLSVSFAIHPYDNAEFFTFVFEFYEEDMPPETPSTVSEVQP